MSILLFCFQERTDHGSVENSLYDGLVDLFPESYSLGGLNTADSGKLLVLSDLLTAIRELSPSDRCVCVFFYLCVCVCVCVRYCICKTVVFVCMHSAFPDLSMNLCPCRVVVVSNYTQTLDLLQDLFVHMGYTFCRLDGHTPTGQRQRLVDSFNSPYSQNFLFLLSSKAGGVGLNLIGASHLVLYDIDWNPANDIQV